MQSKIPPALARFLQLYLPRLRNRHFFVLDILVLSLAPALALVLRLERTHAVYEYGQALFAYRLAAPEIRAHKRWFVLYLFVSSVFFTEFKNVVARVAQQGQRVAKSRPFLPVPEGKREGGDG